jgi:hypothetical protein
MRSWLAGHLVYRPFQIKAKEDGICAIADRYEPHRMRNGITALDEHKHAWQKSRVFAAPGWLESIW